MKKTINEYDFISAFEEIRPDSFSRQGLKAMFDYFTEYEDSCDTEIEFDVIGICCEFTEYEDIEEFQRNYSTDYESIEDIEAHTTVIRIDDEAFIVQDF